MFKVLLFCVCTVALILIIAYFTGKSKTHSKKSSTEKLATTLHSRFEKWINELTNSIRTPEVIQEEMLNAIDEYKLEKLKEIESSVEHLLSTKSKLIKNRSNIVEIRTNLRKRAKEIKRDWESDKENISLLNSGAELLRQADEMDATEKELNKSIDRIKEQIIQIEKATANFNVKIESKRGEVLTLISKYIASDFSTSVKFNFNIDELVSDYKTTIEICQEKEKIRSIAETSTVNYDVQEPLSEEYLEKFKQL